MVSASRNKEKMQEFMTWFESVENFHYLLLGGDLMSKRQQLS